MLQKPLFPQVVFLLYTLLLFLTQKNSKRPLPIFFALAIFASSRKI